MDVLDLKDVCCPPNGTALTVGIFDGVHLGHQRLLSAVREGARQRGCRAWACTFDPHPAEVLSPQGRPPLLTTLSQRTELLAELGLDALVVARDLEALFALSAETFVADVLVRRLGVRHIFEGPDWTFGRGRRGDLRLLRELGRQHGFEVTEVPWVEVNGRRVSSTAVRAMLKGGDVASAAALLGRAYFVDGTVVPGAGRGVGLGVPTANIDPLNELLPAPGVYAGRASLARRPCGTAAPGGACTPGAGVPHPLDDRSCAAALFVGPSLTFGETKPVFEAHLIDFDGELHGSPIRVAFEARLREVRRFDSPEALVAQMRRDIEQARAVTKGMGCCRRTRRRS